MVQLTQTINNIFGDNIAKVEAWDFSRANLSEEARINAVSQIASICYMNPKALNSDSLYNRLMAESIGLPSSSFEFVPVLLSMSDFQDIWNYPKKQLPQIEKYGEWVENDKYLLTNLRALIADIGPKKSKHYYNTEAECEIIAKHFHVFNFKVDLPTRSQMVRHRVNWQELSRRYVSGKKAPFEFYISDKIKTNPIHDRLAEHIKDSLDIYASLLQDGIKPQEARRIIPQAAYTQLWGAFQPTQLQNFLDLRLDSHSQWEIQQIAKAMKETL